MKVQFREKEFFKIPHGMTANEVERETVKRPAERIGAAVEKPAQRVDSVPGTAACVAVAAAAPALQRLSPSAPDRCQMLGHMEPRVCRMLRECIIIPGSNF